LVLSTRLCGVKELELHSGNFGNAEISELDLGYTAAMNLYRNDTFLGYFGVFFYVFAGFDPIDIQFMQVAFATNHIAIPSIFFQEMF
jgi:hypothetical protein